MKIVNIKDLKNDFYTYKEFEGINSVNKIISDVKANGDKSIIEYSQKFGDGSFEQPALSEEEIEKAIKTVPDEIIKILNAAISNVRTFAETQFSVLKDVEVESNGVTLGHKIIPLKIIGAYVPGGNYPLPSSAIMSTIPAKVAGVKEVIVCSPKIQPATIAACKLAGVDKIFRIGGAQAIAGMAYGTETISQVDKIVGPGNKYVTAAKKEVYGVCGIDFLAGPSEVMIIADESANPDFIAADLLAQAEHDLEAECYLITTSESLAQTVLNKINEYLSKITTSAE